MPATSSDQTAYVRSLRRFLYATIEALTALAILLFLALTVIAIPSVVSSIGESEKDALPKADRLVSRPNVDDCSQQAWPHFDRFCLRSGGPGAVKP